MNPARELQSLLSSWNSAKSASVYASRGAQSASHSPLWDEMLRAVRLLDEVREGLSAVDLLDVNRRMLDSIATTVFVPDSQWGGQNTAKRATAEQLGSLASWALILDRIEPQFTLEQVDIDSIREMLSEAKVALLSVPGLGEAHRNYIGELLTAALAQLDGGEARPARCTFDVPRSRGGTRFPAGREAVVCRSGVPSEDRVRRRCILFRPSWPAGSERDCLERGFRVLARAVLDSPGGRCVGRSGLSGRWGVAGPPSVRE